MHAMARHRAFGLARPSIIPSRLWLKATCLLCARESTTALGFEGAFDSLSAGETADYSSRFRPLGDPLVAMMGALTPAQGSSTPLVERMIMHLLNVTSKRPALSRHPCMRALHFSRLP